MRKEFYDRLAKPFEEDEKKKKRLLLVNRGITGALYLTYPALLAALLFLRDPRLMRAILVPLISFLAVTLFRRICNRKRPYEIWEGEPLIPKETRGNSFPSRHVFSVYMIAMAALWVSVPAGIVILAAGVFLAAVRVIGGVHFVSDVIAGAVLGIGMGWIGFFLIPF